MPPISSTETEPRREQWDWFPYLTNVGLKSSDIPEYLTGHNNWESSYVPPYFKNMWKYPKEFSMDALENVTFDRLRVLFSPVPSEEVARIIWIIALLIARTVMRTREMVKSFVKSRKARG